MSFTDVVLKFILYDTVMFIAVVSGSCHHGMARSQVAGEGTACKMKGSCAYIE